MTRSTPPQSSIVARDDPRDCFDPAQKAELEAGVREGGAMEPIIARPSGSGAGMRFVSATLGRIAPRFRAIEAFQPIYDALLATQPLLPKSLHQRRYHVTLLLHAFAGRAIGGIQPHELAVAVRKLHVRSPTTARSVLREARSFFECAHTRYGWIARNPADGLRPLPVPIKRQRLSLEQWQRMHAAAAGHRIKWLRPMLELALVSGQRRADLQKMRFDDVWAEAGVGDCLHVRQQKTGALVALPLGLRLDAAGLTLGAVIERCRAYGTRGETMLRKRRGRPLVTASLSARFEELFEAEHGLWQGPGNPPSLHECRSLSERLYRAQGIDTRTLLGHKRQYQTDVYNDDRGLSAGQWRLLGLPEA